MFSVLFTKLQEKAGGLQVITWVRSEMLEFIIHEASSAGGLQVITWVRSEMLEFIIHEASSVACMRVASSIASEIKITFYVLAQFQCESELNLV